jgi:predicted acetyltransferase
VTHDIRELSDKDDLGRALEVFYTSLVGLVSPQREPEVVDFVEPGRPLGLFLPGPDGEPELVGTAGSFSSRLIVPGGAQVRQAGVTDVGVLATHTRRGLGSALIRHQLAQTAQRGELVATLRASEGGIYERFGYGIASSTAKVELEVGRARLRPTLPAEPEPARVRYADARTRWQLMARIYSGATETGRTERPQWWWRAQDRVVERSKEACYVVTHGEPGNEDGYLRYRPENRGQRSGDRLLLLVDDLVAHTPQAYLGLLRMLLSVDRTETIEFGALPVDHSLEKLVLDERAVRTVAIKDETWLRLVDVPAALSARTYRGSGAVTIAVTDEQLPANTGRYRVSSSGVQRTEQPPELSVDVAALATVYLGGTKWWQLARAGRVREHTGEALARAEELFGTDRLPYAGTMF